MKLKFYKFVGYFLLLSAGACSSGIQNEATQSYPILGQDRLDASIVSNAENVLIEWHEKFHGRAVTVVHADEYLRMGMLSKSEIADSKSSLEKPEQCTPVQQGKWNRATERNYISVAASVGTVGRVYWVVPGKQLESIDAESRVKQLLTTQPLKLRKQDIESMKLDRGCVSGKLSNVAVSVCGAETLPSIPEPVVLDINGGFLAQFSQERSYSNLKGTKEFFSILASRKLRVADADIVLNDMASRTIYRHIAEEAREAMQNPAILKSSAPELWSIRDSLDRVSSQGGQDIASAAREYLKKYPGDKTILFFSALSSLLRGKDLQGMKVLEKLCLDDRDNCYFLLYAAGALTERNRFKAAEDIFRKAIALRPGWQEALLPYADLLYSQKQYSSALERYQELIRIEDEPSFHLAIGDCFFFQNQKKDALLQYDAVLTSFTVSAGQQLTERDRLALTRALQLYEEQGDSKHVKHVKDILGNP